MIGSNIFDEPKEPENPLLKKLLVILMVFLQLLTCVILLLVSFTLVKQVTTYEPHGSMLEHVALFLKWKGYIPVAIIACIVSGFCVRKVIGWMSFLLVYYYVLLTALCSVYKVLPQLDWFRILMMVMGVFSIILFNAPAIRNFFSSGDKKNWGEANLLVLVIALIATYLSLFA